MNRGLKIIMNLPGGKTLTWSLADPKSGLTKTEVETLINDMITRSAILVAGVEPESFKSAYVYETNKVDLA